MYNCEITNNYCFLANSLMNGLYLSNRGELEKHKSSKSCRYWRTLSYCEAITYELDKIANSEDRLQVIKKHFYDYDNVKLLPNEKK